MLIIRNKMIDAPIEFILKTIRKEINGIKLKDILPEKDNNIGITCIKHKNGQERHPSCNIYTKEDDDDTEYGKVHCFTCGYTASFAQFVGDCFDEDESFGEEWLVERFGTPFDSNIRYLPEIILNQKCEKEYLNESILKQYNYYHPYLINRGISKEIIDLFQVGYDQQKQMVTFPVWDEKDNLVLITARSVKDKRFNIDKDKEKPVYLLNHILKNNIKTVYVCESQVNALTLWSWGYPAIAMIGTGSKTQYDILNKCSIRNYILCFDGDEAGDKGITRFQNNIREDVFVTVKKIPRNKDVNDLTKEQFDNLLEL